MVSPKPNIKNLFRMKDWGSHRSGLIRLDKNERTVPFDDAMYREMMATVTAEDLTMYPDQTPLYQKLAKFTGLQEQELLLTPGSDAAIKMIYETYIGRGDKVVFLDPTYAMIEVYADMFEAEKIKIGYSDDLRLDIDQLISKITKETRAVFIANPNQPTGTLISPADIRRLLETTKSTDTLIVLDEAYMPFSSQTSALNLVREYPNLIVTQTFSKALGLASVRLGYMASQSINIDSLFKVKTLSDINGFAVKLGGYLIDHYEKVEVYIRQIRESKDYLDQELKKLGIACILGHTNFIHVKFPAGVNLKLIATELKEQGYLVRTQESGLPAVLLGCIRITLGPKPQMEAFKDTLEKILQGKRKKDVTSVNG